MADVRARLGTAVKHWRSRQKLTQEGLAERAGLSYKFIGEIERGAANPTIETVARLALALGLDVTDLFGEAGENFYQLSHGDLQSIREAIESMGEVIDHVSPAYRPRRRRPRARR